MIMERRAFFQALAGGSAIGAVASAKIQPAIDRCAVMVRVRHLLGDDRYPGGEVFTDRVLAQFLQIAARRYRTPEYLAVATAALAAWSKGLHSLGDRYAALTWRAES